MAIWVSLLWRNNDLQDLCDLAGKVDDLEARVHFSLNAEEMVSMFPWAPCPFIWLIGPGKRIPTRDLDPLRLQFRGTSEWRKLMMMAFSNTCHSILTLIILQSMN